MSAAEGFTDVFALIFYVKKDAFELLTKHLAVVTSKMAVVLKQYNMRTDAEVFRCKMYMFWKI